MDPMDPGQEMNPLEGVPSKAAGYDPMTLQSDMYVRLMESDALAPERSVEERLAEIDRLHQSGAISPEERARARERILGGS